MASVPSRGRCPAGLPVFLRFSSGFPPVRRCFPDPMVSHPSALSESGGTASVGSFDSTTSRLSARPNPRRGACPPRVAAVFPNRRPVPPSPDGGPSAAPRPSCAGPPFSCARPSGRSAEVGWLIGGLVGRWVGGSVGGSVGGRWWRKVVACRGRRMGDRVYNKKCYRNHTDERANVGPLHRPKTSSRTSGMFSLPSRGRKTAEAYGSGVQVRPSDGGRGRSTGR